MDIRLATAQEKDWILQEYPYTQEVLGHHEDEYIIIAVLDEKIIGFAGVFRRKILCPVNEWEDFINVIEVFDQEDRNKGVASHMLWRKNKFGISPVQMETRNWQVVGSFVTYVL